MYKLLLVDDDSRILKSFSRILQKKGYQIKAVENAQKALEAINEFTPDLIISDMRMQPMDGVEFMKSIPEINGFYPGKIIFTAFDDGDAQDMANLGKGGVFRVEKERWETDLIPAISRSLELREIRLDSWEQGKKIGKQSDEISKLRFLTTVATTLGHEINNPLQAIAAANEILIKKIGKQSSSKAIKENVIRINDVTKKLANLPGIKEVPYSGNNWMLEI